ncbi:hypothetical protein BTI85_04360, partial [Lactobacillus delbrueckii subsp. bulgaricus]|nr:hypothetical protein [Lactobacillus delbrueckii subsp. bulgaricus]
QKTDFATFFKRLKRVDFLHGHKKVKSLLLISEIMQALPEVKNRSDKLAKISLGYFAKFI